MDAGDGLERKPGSKVIEGSALRRAEKQVRIKFVAGGKSRQSVINLTGLPPKFTTKVPAFTKISPQEFPVRFELGADNQISNSTLEVAEEKILTDEQLISNFNARRAEAEKVSSSTNLKTGTSGCAKGEEESPAATPAEQIPANAVKIDEILNKANAGISDRINRIQSDRAKNVPVKCEACQGPEHTDAPPMSFNTWYYLNEIGSNNELSERAQFRLNELRQAIKTSGFICHCGLKAIPKSPVNVFARPSQEQVDRINKLYENRRDNLKKTKFDRADLATAAQALTDRKNSQYSYEVLSSIQNKEQINHIVPMSAGGCPVSAIDISKQIAGKDVPPANLIPIWNMCLLCQVLDKLFTKWQGEQQHKDLSSFKAQVINKKASK